MASSPLYSSGLVIICGICTTIWYSYSMDPICHHVDLYFVRIRMFLAFNRFIIDEIKRESQYNHRSLGG